MFVELHIIQSFAPSNLNRDDTGSPKDCDFGGVRRARVSSQCLKRAIRRSPIFAETTRVPNGLRTRWLARRLKEALVAAGKPADQAAAVANRFTEAYVRKVEKVKDSDVHRTVVLIYVSAEEVASAVDGLVAKWDDVVADEKGSLVANLAAELAKRVKGRTSAPDIAMFGRMLADDPSLNLPAARQEEHAISTHRVKIDMDFYTAVDDLAEKEETGAGMMGVTGLNSACFYRYARVDLGQLLQNLDGDAALAGRTLEAFLRASVAAVPSGKQNSTAAYNPPSFLLAVVRADGQGWSLANAFEKPIQASREGGLVARSVEALAAYYAAMERAYGNGGTPVALALERGLALGDLKAAVVDSLEEWVAAVKGAVRWE
jgi:CRISPR system Cascade subunit CasC